MKAYERRYSAPHMAGRPVTVEKRSGGHVLAGHAAVNYDPNRVGTEYQLWDGAVERIRPGAFDRALRDRHDVRALFNHDPDNLLGRTSSGTCRLYTTSLGLAYEIDIDPLDQDHQRVLLKIERGDLTGSSFAFRADKVYWDEPRDGPEVRWIEDVTLYDVGPVTFPAYEATTTGWRTEDEIEDLRAERDRWIAAKNSDFELKLKRLQILKYT